MRFKPFKFSSSPTNKVLISSNEVVLVSCQAITSCFSFSTMNRFSNCFTNLASLALLASIYLLIKCGHMRWYCCLMHDLTYLSRNKAPFEKLPRKCTLTCHCLKMNSWYQCKTLHTNLLCLHQLS